LAEQDPYQFQLWTLELVGARPVERKKGYPRRGIDGRIYFHDEVDSFYESPALHGNLLPRLQLLTIAELLEGRTIELPLRHELTFKKAPNLKGTKESKNKKLVFDPGRDESQPADRD
jgi:hypothetical protein